MTDSYNQTNINQPAPSTSTNASGATMVEGQIVAQSPATDDAVVLSSAASQVDIIGVVSVGADDGELITLSSSCVFNVLVIGAVTRGDLIESSATAGIGQVTGAFPGVFAIAIESNADAGQKLVRCRWIRAEAF